MIGGHDLTFRVIVPAPAIVEGVVRLLLKRWTAATLEDALTGERVEFVPGRETPLPGEIFIYRDAEACRSWQQLGAVPETANNMVHLLQGDQTVTLVVDDPQSGEMKSLLDEVSQYLTQDIFWIPAAAA